MPTDFLAGLYADTTALVKAEYPEVAAKTGAGGKMVNGIWQVEHLSQVPYAEITPPYAVIHVQDLSASSDFGATCDSYVGTIDVYYVCQISGPLASIQRKLMALRQRINAKNPAPEWMQILALKGMAWGDDLPPNQFFSEKKMSHRAGRLRFTALVQDSFFATDEE